MIAICSSSSLFKEQQPIFDKGTTLSQALEANPYLQIDTPRLKSVLTGNSINAVITWGPDPQQAQRSTLVPHSHLQHNTGPAYSHTKVKVPSHALLPL